MTNFQAADPSATSAVPAAVDFPSVKKQPSQPPAGEQAPLKDASGNDVVVSLDKPAFRSEDAARPLQYVDPKGNVFTYFAEPMWKAASFILILEGLERFSYYVLQPEFPNYLVNPAFGDMSQADASAVISMSSGITYVWPLLGGAIGDSLTGSYKGILGFSAVYLCALVLMCMMGSTAFFQPWMIPVLFYVLLPMGMGGVKSLIGVMGADQFHPVLHQDQIQSYYLKFYMVINIFAFASTAVNVYANTVGDELWKAYAFPVVAFSLGVCVFVAFTHRYVRRTPLGSVAVEVAKVGGRAVASCGLDKQRESRGGKTKDSFVDDTWRMLALIPFLFICMSMFNVSYSYLSNYMIYQGGEMNPTGGIESNVLNSAVNPMSIIGLGLLLDFCVWPALRKRNLEPSIMNKIILGCLCGLLAMLWQVLLEFLIKDSWSADRTQSISIFAQVPCYALVGLGEILVNPSGYALAYEMAPDSFKGLASGISIFMVGGAPNFIVGALAKATTEWQTDATGCASRFDEDCSATLIDPATGDVVWDYTTTNMQNLYWVGAAISLFGMVLVHFVCKPIYAKFKRGLDTEANTEEATSV